MAKETKAEEQKANQAKETKAEEQKFELLVSIDGDVKKLTKKDKELLVKKGWARWNAK